MIGEGQESLDLVVEVDIEANPNITFFNFAKGFDVNVALAESKGEVYTQPSFEIKSIDRNGKLVISFSEEILVQDLALFKKIHTGNKPAMHVISSMEEG